MLFVFATVPCHGEYYPAAGSIHHRRRVAAGVLGIVPHHNHLSPRLATIFRATCHKVYVARVASTVAARLGKGYQRAFAALDDGWDAECVVALHARVKECCAKCLLSLRCEHEEH